MALHLSSMVSAAATKSLHSCPTLCDPIESSPPGSPVPGILQARILEWGVIAFSIRKTRYYQKVLTVNYIYTVVRNKTHTQNNGYNVEMSSKDGQSDLAPALLPQCHPFHVL